MNSNYKVDNWSIVEEKFNPAMQEASESIFSLGNGRMGQRANFEEKYSGESLQGNYIAGVYYPDKTRVGWWKNGYPEFFAKVLNAPDWIGIGVVIDGVEIDLNELELLSFRRELNMREGYLERIFAVRIDGGKTAEIKAKRFLSIADDEIGAIRYSVKPLDFNATIEFSPHINGDVRNRDSNYNEMFWDLVDLKAGKGDAHLVAETRKSGFRVGFSMKYEIELDGSPVDPDPEIIERKGYVGNTVRIQTGEGSQAVLYKYVSVISSLNHSKEAMVTAGKEALERAFSRKFDQLFDDHRQLWNEKWAHSDIVIEGDEKAQQAIRFNIFHLNQTYTGKDERLNIGPKGFTGEKYGGSTYWDTEAYLFYFYLSSSPAEVARNLLIYRYKHLQRAIENAELLGFRNGAALYPMVTMDGRECHNEWEITFEEIHRNGAIAYAIYNYIRYTGDRKYLAEYGLEVLIAISRFWRQRVNWSDVRGKYVMLGVTGPNEYENNVNNNWYTNLMARWTLQYTLEAVSYVRNEYLEKYDEIRAKTGFNEETETERWTDIINNLYFPYSGEKKIFLQQDGYMDKKQIFASDIEPSERPINQHWSWDRILRSPFIKQADVLQGIYFFEDDYLEETLRRNFDFYEPRTVHESSLSPCIHSVLASKLGRKEIAYEMYLRTSRLDLDDYNKEVGEGLHITSMGGTWMSVVYGFGGMRVKNDMLHLTPSLPDQWKSLSFNIIFRENYLKIYINTSRITIENEKGPSLVLMINGEEQHAGENQTLQVKLKPVMG
ncbi:MAG: glycoside hydrolase family 65 protein [Bacteroidales bacterium]|nr:glycoside hydrolase family 65 protein [Bacteroidales bacterium]